MQCKEKKRNCGIIHLPWFFDIRTVFSGAERDYWEKVIFRRFFWNFRTFHEILYQGLIKFGCDICILSIIMSWQLLVILWYWLLEQIMYSDSQIKNQNSTVNDKTQGTKSKIHKPYWNCLHSGVSRHKMNVISVLVFLT